MIQHRRIRDAVVLAACWSIALFEISAHGQSTNSDLSPLRDLASQCGIWIGPAVAYGPLIGEAIYADTLGREFSILTPENDMKWAPIHPQQFQYSFDRADALVAFAGANGMTVHGHTLVWHNQIPSWLSSGSFTRDEMIDILRDHIHTVVGRYSGAIAAWDVVNEAVNDDGSLRSTLWLTSIGPEYLDLAFQFTSDADPNARLVYNDYGNESINAKSNGIYDLVSGMLVRGIPIHGVGFQLHITLAGINLASFAQNMQRFADLGLEIYITELDVRMQLPVTPEKLATQANVYAEILKACLAQPACRAFQMWGFTDGHSWVPSSFPGYGAALIFDEAYQPKPAYDALAQGLSQCAPVGAATAPSFGSANGSRSLGGAIRPLPLAY